MSRRHLTALVTMFFVACCWDIAWADEPGQPASDGQAVGLQPVNKQPVDKQPVDKQPVDKQPVDKQPVDKQPGATPSDVRLSKPERLENGGLRFMVEPIDCLEATVTISGELQGYTASHPLPWTFSLRGKPEQLELTPAETSAPEPHYQINYRWRPGPVGARHDPTAIYRLPYPPDRRWLVTQGNFGRFSHEAGSGNEYSVDWAMPSGSPVCAARGGTVLAIKQDSEIGGPNRRFEDDANYIQIRHADGTCGEYLHLEAGSAAVRVGQPVEAGQLIGRAGNTGNSTEPHLHFGVFTNRDTATKTPLAIRWQTRRGVTDRLVEGQRY